MTCNVELIKYNSEKSWKNFSTLKGTIGPFAEKAVRNIELLKNGTNPEKRMHYFSIGHVFKQIDTQNVFKLTLDEESRTVRPTAFTSLQHFDDSFCMELPTLIESIRDINSHYVHDFSKLKQNDSSAKMVSFLRESFELAVCQIYLKEKELNYQDYSALSDKDERLVAFLLDKFYPFDKTKSIANEKTLRFKKIRMQFKNETKQEAIDSVLFIKVDTAFECKLYNLYPAFKVDTGIYLSFYASLFLLTMFLYKNEAEKFISMIHGFKKNGTPEEQSKRDIFTFFSKKFSSQDIDSEEYDLVKFRDIVQYLNQYPVEWNKELELNPVHPIMVKKLISKIIEMEIDECFPDYAGNERFLIFARYKIWGKRYLGKEAQKNYIDQAFTEEENAAFNYEIDTSPELKGCYRKLEELKSKKELSENDKKNNRSEIFLTEKRIKEIKDGPNLNVERLKERIQGNYRGWSRNQDRFMKFATRFLAETNYFGEDVRFKMYCYFSTNEENAGREVKKDSLSKKDYDKLKFNKGRQVDYFTYKDHMKLYPYWDTPFVVENNAIQIKISLGDDPNKIVSIQRGLMIYFLQDALSHVPENQFENAGKHLIEAYYIYYQEAYNRNYSVLEQQTSISLKEKNQFKKLFPVRLLNHYSPAISSHINGPDQLDTLLNKTIEAEKRYLDLVQKAFKEGNSEVFLKKNRGKQFKLQFIRKAWQLMFFREIYDKRLAFSNEHHKSYNITRDEFNNFCRYMYVFDEVPMYKDYLHELLAAKGFFDNSTFKKLFESGHSLDDFYKATKVAYKSWVVKQEQIFVSEDKYTLNKYDKLLNKNILYINLSHFLEFLKRQDEPERKNLGEMKFKALGNVQYLIQEYYYSERLDNLEQKDNRCLFNKLRKIKLEDALLYEMAFYYLKTDERILSNAKCLVANLLNQDIQFDIKNADGNHLYTLVVPFKQIYSLACLLKQKEEQEQRKFKSSFLGNLAGYLEKNRNQKELGKIYKDYNSNPHNKVLNLDELNKIKDHLVTSSVKFTKLDMALEAYYISLPDKNGNVDLSSKIEKAKTGCNLIRFENTGIPKKYYSTEIRNIAFHFCVPDKTYNQILRDIEKKFIVEEVEPIKPANFESLSVSLKAICSLFLDELHSDFFDHREKDNKKKHQNAEKKYFEKEILNN